MSIANREDYNAVLLAISLILQRNTVFLNERSQLASELTQLLSDLSADFGENGDINNQILIDTLIHNASQLDLVDIRENIEGRYRDLGVSTSIPSFEPYVAKFQEKHCSYLYTDFHYPEFATPDLTAMELRLPNLLDPYRTDYRGYSDAIALAVYVPFGSELTIRIKSAGSGCAVGFGGPIYGWHFEGGGFVPECIDGVITLNAQRKNALVTALIHPSWGGGSVEVEYYENSLDTPTFSKTVTW